ncbi:class I tRNA ligase family protein, partial [Candidatus Woesearchaeota archaeon]|nr:class I tRNA ligase family protein [Candidatus Woesearchaeota archaeon]
RWVPEWAGSRWFDSWLENLQDWCISRQRFWGIPLPIWKCGECGRTKMISTRKELPQKLENLHRPWIDDVVLKCSCGGEMKRIADVLDVWLDSGAASWAPLNYPGEEERFEELWPADLILEGKDQIRGWFNSMICLSMVSFKRNCYKAVYMHGFVNDALGRKMSKSLKNIISPYEVIDKYGADTLRYYAIGGANPGFDLNYNFDDMKVKHKNLTVFWNLHNFLLDLAETAQLDGDKTLATEERYILSKLHTAIQKATYMMDNNYLNEAPGMVEDLLLELSRTYIQLTREKASGSEEERNTVLHTAYTVFLEALKMLAPIAPFITEQMHLGLKKKFDLQEESIHHHDWPMHDQELIDEELEKEFETAKSAIQAILSVREKIKQGVRWPQQEAIIVSTGLKTAEVIEAVKRQANVKEIKVVHKYEGAKTSVKADYDTLLPEFGSQKATRIIAALAMTAPETVLRYIERDGEFSLSLENEKVVLGQKHFTVTKQAPHGYEWAEFDKGEVYVNIMTSPELEAEGYARELTRKIQNMRKLAGLRKQQRISVHVNTAESLAAALKSHAESIREKVGAEKLHLSTQPSVHTYAHSSREKIRDKELWIGIDVV